MRMAKEFCHRRIKSEAMKKIPECKPGMTKSKGCSPTVVQPIALSHFVYVIQSAGQNSGRIYRLPFFLLMVTVIAVL